MTRKVPVAYAVHIQADHIPSTSRPSTLHWMVPTQALKQWFPRGSRLPSASLLRSQASLHRGTRSLGVWHGVAMGTLKFHPGQPRPTLLRPAGGPPLKRSEMVGIRHLPLWAPHAVCLSLRCTLSFITTGRLYLFVIQKPAIQIQK
jgi:hypothetical protein